MAKPPPPPNGASAKAQHLFAQGLALHQNGRLPEAVAFYEQALHELPEHFDALHLLGIISAQGKDYTRAIALFDQATALKPNAANAAPVYGSRGIALKQLERFEEAIGSYDKAIALNPNYGDAYYNRAIALSELNRFAEAVSSYDRAIALKPDHAKAYLNRGFVLNELKRFDEAIASYDRAISLVPDYAEAYANRGLVLSELDRFEEAIASYNKALASDPDYPVLIGSLLHAKMQLCDWAGLADNLARYERDTGSLKKVTPPFAALSLVDAPALHKIAAQLYSQAEYPKTYPSANYQRHAKNDKIRIGYFSADFRNHAIGFLTAGLFECHDRSRFELHGFYFGPDQQDETRRRISSAFDIFYDVRDQSDEEVARHARELGIDIAIDLMGHTAHGRMGIFAQRCAPIQASYLGYPGTSGTDYIDYIIADLTVIPKDRQLDFTEAVAYLPNSYQVNDSKRKISAKIFTRQELGLPESGFVFCCFNNNYKILPATFDIWMQLLKTIESSVLWLLESNPTAAKNLRQEAEQRGVDGARLVFAQRMPPDEHLARHRLADLFIDTLPYNAHTTASDALWAGLPVLTCMGKSFASRVAGSLLKAIDLRELITQSPAEYEALAIALARDTEKLKAIRKKLERNRLTAPLFNTKLFTRDLEAAYVSMYERYQSGLPPQTIE